MSDVDHNMIEPINKVDSEGIQGQDSALNRVSMLRELLHANRSTQTHLRTIMQSVSQRLQLIRSRQDISQYELNTQHPFPTGLIKYLSSNGHLPTALKEQLSIKNFSRQDHGIARGRRKKKQAFVLPDKPTHDDFIKLARVGGVRSGLQEYKEWSKRQEKSKVKKVLFTAEEDRQLVQLHNKYGENWEKICQSFEERSFEELYFEYHNRIFSSETEPERKRKWSVQESIKLIALREHFGPRRWANIAKKLKSKSQLQVRERFVNILDPNIGDDKISREAIEKLMQAAHQEKYKWNVIKKIKEFKGKTDNALWRKFRNIMIEKSQSVIRKEVSQEKLAQKLIRIKRKKEKQKKIHTYNQGEGNINEQIFEQNQ